jgi:nitrogen fixation protein FixH
MNTSRPFTGRTILLYLIGFFGVVFAVNTAFIYYAEHSFPGLSNQNAYERGLEYNRVLDDAAAQRALGWRVVLRIMPATKSLMLSIRDAAGNPIDTAAVLVDLDRPAEANDDRHLVLAHTTAGTYQSDNVLASGNWNASVHIRSGGETFVLEQRVWVP